MYQFYKFWITNGSIVRLCFKSMFWVFLLLLSSFADLSFNSILGIHAIDLCTGTQIYRASGVLTFGTSDSLLITSDTKSKAPACQL